MWGEVAGLAAAVAAGSAGWWGRGRSEAAKAPTPLETPITLPPPASHRYQIVLSTADGNRAKKIYERAEVAPKETVALWDDGVCRGTRAGPKA